MRDPEDNHEETEIHFGPITVADPEPEPISKFFVTINFDLGIDGKVELVFNSNWRLFYVHRYGWYRKGDWRDRLGVG